MSSLVAAVAGVLRCILAATRAGQTWLGERYLPRTQLDAGVKNSIRTIFGYVGVVVALLAGGSRLGVDADRLAWVAGGLSVGIGFGLQGIANNFISGLILLVGARHPRRRLGGGRPGAGLRAPHQRALDRDRDLRARDADRAQPRRWSPASVKNWMHTDRVARIIDPVNAAFESDPESGARPADRRGQGAGRGAGDPAPLALFSEFGDWAMKFQLIAYVDDALMAERVRSPS